MEKINVMYDEDTLMKRIGEVADELYKVYGDEEVLFVSVLKGAIFFTVDLAKKYKGDARFQFIRVSSYEGENSTGNVTVKIPLKEENIRGKHVLIVEDIIDTGRTMEFLVNYIKEMGAKSVKSCVLLDKKTRRVVSIDADFSCFSIPDAFVIGYGLDYDEKYRNLPYIGVVVNE